MVRKDSPKWLVLEFIPQIVFDFVELYSLKKVAFREILATMFYIGKALIQSSQVMLVIGLSCWRLCRLIITPVHHVLFSSVDHIITSIKIKKIY